MQDGLRQRLNLDKLSVNIGVGATGCTESSYTLPEWSHRSYNVK